MGEVDRRLFLVVAAAGVSGVLAGCTGRTWTPVDATTPTTSAGDAGQPEGSAGATGVASPDPSGKGLLPLQHGPPAMSAPPGPPGALIDRLPTSAGNTVALTIDDGADSNVVKAYLDLAEATGIRLTFFVTAAYPSWAQHRDQLRPLVDSGQVQLANHTWDHPDLRKLSPGEVADQLNRCETFLKNTFGVSAKPFFRPPYGFHSAQTDATAAALGFTTTVMWLGGLGHSSRQSEEEILADAQRWLLAQHIVIGHANQPSVTHVYGQFLDILRSRSLQTVTLDDAFYGLGGRRRTVG